MIELTKLNGLLDVDTTVGTESIKVQAGMTVEALSTNAAANGLTLLTTTVIPQVQVGGAFANGAHGTGLLHPHFTDLVSHIEPRWPGASRRTR